MYLSSASSIFWEMSIGPFVGGPPAAGVTAGSALIEALAASETEPGGSWRGTTRELSTRPFGGCAAAAPSIWRCRSAACMRNALVAASFETVMAGAAAGAATLMPRPRASGIGGWSGSTGALAVEVGAGAVADAEGAGGEPADGVVAAADGAAVEAAAVAMAGNGLVSTGAWVSAAACSVLSSGWFAACAGTVGVDWEPPAHFEARTAHLLPGLFLARVDGKSPVEYVTEEVDKNRVRKVANAFLRAPAERLAAVADAWLDELN